MHAIFSKTGTNNFQIPLKLMIKEKNSKELYNVIHVYCMCVLSIAGDIPVCVYFSARKEDGKLPI